MDNLSLTCTEIPPLILTEIYLKVFVNFIKISSRRYSKDTPRNLSLLFLKHFTKKPNEFHHDFSEISQKIFSMSYKSLVIKRFPWTCLKEVSGACSRDSTRDFPRNFSMHYYKEFLWNVLLRFFQEFALMSSGISQELLQRFLQEHDLWFLQKFIQ